MKKDIRKYDLIISLGMNCACSMYLRKHNLQNFSYPFDWLTNAPFETRVDLILNDFENFINKDDLVKLEKTPHLLEDKYNNFYENNRNSFLYYHDFPKGVAFDDAYDVVKQKYQRRIDRLYKLIKESKKVLFIWFFTGDAVEDEKLISTQKSLSKKFGKDIELLVFENNNSDNHNKYVEEKPNQYISKFVGNIAYHTDPKDIVVGNKKLNDKIFAKYKLKKKIKNIILSFIKRELIKFLSVFIFNKQKRRAFKNRYK